MEPDRGSDQSDPATETPEAPPRRRSKLKILLAIITALAGLCIIAYVVENIRGKWAWVAFREDLEARGEKLDYRQWIPAPIPSEKNFAHTPLLKPLFETEYDEDFGTFTPTDPEKHEQAERLLQGLLEFEDLPAFIRWPDGQRVELVAGCFSRDSENTRATAAELNVAPERAYATWEEMAEGEAELPEDQRIEAVSIVTPNHVHAGPAIGFMEKGFDKLKTGTADS